MNTFTKLTKRLILPVVLMLAVITVQAQDEDALAISGSVDTYYFADPSGVKNRGTSFAPDHNSISIGMVDLNIEKTVGKASFVGEIAFGPRASNTAPGAVQNLYVSYALTEKLSVTGGFMGTFIGYEVISPAANFNYTASYLFSNGPFQNAGVKLDYSISDSFAVMVGLFNDPWDAYTATDGIGNLGAQIYVAPVDGWDVWANLYYGENYQQWDITTGFQATDALYIGANVSQNLEYGGDPDGGFFGAAGYFQYAFTDAVALGLRYENFAPEASGSSSINSLTLSANVAAGPLTLIPEVRLDSSDNKDFVDADKMPANSFTEFGLAAVYSF